MMMAQSEFITSNHCAKLIGKPESFLRQSRSKNAVKRRYKNAPPYIKDPVTGKVRYRRDVVNAWLSRRTKGERI